MMIDATISFVFTGSSASGGVMTWREGNLLFVGMASDRIHLVRSLGRLLGAAQR